MAGLAGMHRPGGAVVRQHCPHHTLGIDGPDLRHVTQKEQQAVRRLGGTQVSERTASTGRQTIDRRRAGHDLHLVLIGPPLQTRFEAFDYQQHP